MDSSRAEPLRSYLSLYCALGGGWISKEERQANEAQQVEEVGKL